MLNLLFKINYSLNLTLISFKTVCVCVCVYAQTLSCDQLVTPWTAAHQAPLSMEFSRQEYWSGLPMPSPCMLNIFFFCMLNLIEPNMTTQMTAPAWVRNWLGPTGCRRPQWRMSSLPPGAPRGATSPAHGDRPGASDRLGRGETWGRPFSGQLTPGATERQHCQNSASVQAEGRTPVLCVCWMSRLGKRTPSPTLPLSATPIPSPVSERPSSSGPTSPLSFPYTPHLQSQPLLA